MLIAKTLVRTPRRGLTLATVGPATYRLIARPAVVGATGTPRSVDFQISR